MKKLLIYPLFFCLLFASLETQAQTSATDAPKTDSKFFIRVYGGYGLLTPGSYVPTGSFTTSSSGSNYNSAYTSKKTGLGSGLHYGGGIGFVVNDFLNLGIDGEYLQGAKLTNGNNYSSSSANSTYTSVQSTTYTHSLISVIPSITFKALSKPTYYIYNRVGIPVAVQAKFDNTSIGSSTSTYTAPAETIVDGSTSKTSYKFNLGVGVQTAIGVQFKLTEHLRGFAELVGNFISLNATTSTQTSTDKKVDTKGGVTTTTITNSTAVYTYKSSYNSTGVFTSNSPGVGSPAVITTSYTADEPPQKFNMNYIAVNVGLAYRF